MRIKKQVGAGEGSRTLNPVRERDFESRAYAIPPLRQAQGTVAMKKSGVNHKSALDCDIMIK